MFNKIVKTTVALTLVATVVFGANSARFNVIEGDASKKYADLIENDLNSIDFEVSEARDRVDSVYAARYGNPDDPDYDKNWAKNLDNLSFFSISNDKVLHELLKTNPEVAGFAPFNELIYKKASEDKTYVGHLDPTTMLDIVGTKNANVRKAFIAMYDPLDDLVNKRLGGKVEIKTFAALPAKSMMKFEVPVDRAGELSDFIDAFQEKYEAAFEDKKYIIAGFKNFKETYEEDLGMEFAEYDAFFVYSLCHFTFSYNVFNKGRPDGGVFAPCSMYSYIKKDSNTMVIGMPTLSNWTALLNITDPVKQEWVKKIDAEIISIMKSMGAKEI
ncbi:MAG: hypothetical protein ACI9TV_001504 [Sulfurimonas sp.]|jgi:uncharacterized protein (DUF302 family)|uniref:hypothetical protein n=1 Tax=Sulfurimonas sp. TaxID=2022749 RepID=UPI0039E5D872